MDKSRVHKKIPLIFFKLCYTCNSGRCTGGTSSAEINAIKKNVSLAIKPMKAGNAAKTRTQREIQGLKSGLLLVIRGGHIHFIIHEASYHFGLLMVSSFFAQSLCFQCNLFSPQSFFLPFCSSSITCLLHVIFGRPRPLLPTTSKSNALLYTSLLSFLKTCPYHRSLFALASLSKAFFKPSKSINSWLLLFFINLTQHSALIIAFSIFFFKIALFLLMKINYDLKF